MNDYLYDIAIIGGGIGGCATAIELARDNHSVILCEAKSYPHHKVCGEFLSPECTAMLDALDLTAAIQAVKPAAIHKAAIIAPNGTSWETELPGIALGISRYTLDNLMATHARACGVDFRESTTVTQIQGDLESTFRLETRTATHHESIHARTVIGAHGKRSTIDRALDRPFLKNPQHFVGLKNHFIGKMPPSRIQLYTFPGGYCGLSEIEDGQVNACLLVRTEVFQGVCEGSIDRFIEWMKTQNPTLGTWLRTAQPIYKNWISIAQVSFANKQAVVHDMLMVGDSAGLIPPLAGDGMGIALQASFIASSLLKRYLAGQISAECVRRQYAADWGDAFGLRLRLSSILQAIMLRPNWLTLGLHLINAAPPLGQFLLNQTRDSKPVQI
ncbi:MAG: FAD-dependent oxidoreductase [Chloroflexota bacterium]